MAWTKSATPTADLRLAEREKVRIADCLQHGGLWRRRPLMRERRRHTRLWPLNRYALIASLTHLILIATSAVWHFSVSPAQASVGATLGSPLHLGLLVFSGTAAALLMLAANHQRRTAPPNTPMVSLFIHDNANKQGNTNKRGYDNKQSNSANQTAAAHLPLHHQNSPRHNNADQWAELMARASHELRTPLNAVIGFSDVMQRELLGPIAHERYREYITHIRDSGFALLRSTEDTLALTNLIGKTDVAQFCDIELDPLIRQAWLAVPHNGANPNVELIVDIDKDIMLHCNKAAMRQAMINLFVDAISHAAPRSPLTLQLSDDGDALSLNLSCQRRQKGCQKGHCQPVLETSTPLQAQGPLPQDRPLPSELPFVMARALLQLQDAELTRCHDDAAQWSVSIAFNHGNGDNGSNGSNGDQVGLSGRVPTVCAPRLLHDGQLH